MKLPTIRRDETRQDLTGPADVDRGAAPPPLSITVTQTVDDKVQAYMLQRVAYNLNKSGWRPMQIVLWLWLGALLSFGAAIYDDIKSQGFWAYVEDAPLMAFLPGLIILVVLTVIVYLWGATAIRRRKASTRKRLRMIGEASSERLDIVLDGDGIVIASPSGMVRMLAWQDGLQFYEDESLFCFYNAMQEMNVVIPKRDLSADETRSIRLYNGERQRIGLLQPPAISPLMIGREISRSEDFSASKDDLIAAMLQVANARSWRGPRFRSYILTGIALSLVTPVLYFIGWAVDPDRLPLPVALPLYLEMFASFFWKPAAIAVVIVAAFAFIQEHFQRFGAGLFANSILASGTFGIASITVGENGLWGQSPLGCSFTPWSAVRVVKITDQHFLTQLPLGSVAAYPKRIFPQETLAEVDRRFRERIGKPNNGDGGTA